MRSTQLKSKKEDVYLPPDLHFWALLIANNNDTDTFGCFENDLTKILIITKTKEFTKRNSTMIRPSQNN